MARSILAGQGYRYSHYLLSYVAYSSSVLYPFMAAAVYAVTVYPADGFEWRYALADLGISAAAIIAFQMFDIYATAAFRTHVHQLSRLGLAWTLVFLVALALAFFIKFEDTISRGWAAGWYAIGRLKGQTDATNKKQPRASGPPIEFGRKKIV